jgi:Na+-transporting NADH:ubiquinone oxidoreductase subunit A
MPEHALKRGLDLPIAGAPAATITDAAAPSSVALVADDYVGLKFKMLATEGDEVRRGQPLFAHKDSPEVLFTAPMTGRVRAINRGARRALQSVVIDVTDAADSGEDFGAVAEADIAGMAREAVAGKLQASGLWTAFRTRPYSKVPLADAVPAAIFVTAMESEPLAGDAAMVIATARQDFAVGLTALTRLTEGPVFLCQAPGDSLAGRDIAGVEVHGFAGPHPAGLAGTHIHLLMPPTAARSVWHVGYPDVIAIGRLLLTGHLNPERVVALGGPMASNPRMLRTVTGADIAGLVEGEIIDGDLPCRVISGSVLSGRAAEGPFGYVGRYARQITLIAEDRRQETLGWIIPQPNKYAVQPVLASSFLGRKLFGLTTNLNGGRRAMVPVGTFERLMPQDYLPTQLLRALLVMDTDTAQALGALELDEEDLALCTFACPAKYEYGDALRASLAKIEKEG